MSLQRVTYKGEVFGRKNESENEWLVKNHTGEKPLASVNMEIFGEVEPVAISDNSLLCDLSSRKSFIYEYIWNIGLTGIDIDWLEKCDADDTLLIQIIVQSGNSRFTSQEIFATLEYLPPTRNVAGFPNILKKVIGGAGSVAKDIGFKTIGSLTTFVSDIIPSQDEHGAKWYLHKFDYPLDSQDNQQAYGVEWHISKKLIYEVGSRLVGRIGILFADAPIQGKIHNPSENTIVLFGKFGLKLADEKGRWYCFGMLPKKDSDLLRLSICPKESTK